VEHRGNTDEGDEVWGVDGKPTTLCGVEELVGHRIPAAHGNPAPWSPWSAIVRWRRLIRSGWWYASVSSVRRVTTPAGSAVDKLGDRLAVLGAVVERLEGFDSDLGLVDVFGVTDVIERG
jgi:hypothetical protein